MEKIQQILMENPWLLGLGVLVVLAVGISVVLTAPQVTAPTNVQAQVNGYNVLLNWQPATGSFQSYVILRGVSDDVQNANRIATLAPAILSYSDGPVSPGTYYYWVAAVDNRDRLFYSKPVEVVVSEVNPVIKYFYASPHITNDTLVVLYLSTKNVDRCRFREEGQAWNTWVSPPSQMPWRISNKTGSRYIEVECADPFGTNKANARTTVVYDPEPPMVNFTFRKISKPPEVKLYGKINWTDITEVSCSLFFNGSLIYSLIEPGSFMVNLPPKSGLLQLRCNDEAGNHIVHNYMINYTGQPEFFGYLTIENNRSYTRSRDVDVVVFAPESDKVRCKDNGSADWTPWEPFQNGEAHLNVELTSKEGLHTIMCEVVFFNESFNLSGSIYYRERDNGNRPFLELDGLERYTNKHKMSFHIYWGNCQCRYSVKHFGLTPVSGGACEHTVNVEFPDQGDYRVEVTCGNLEESRPITVDWTPPTIQQLHLEEERIPGYVRVDYGIRARDDMSGLDRVCINAVGPFRFQKRVCDMYDPSGTVDIPVPADIPVDISAAVSDRAGNWEESDTSIHSDIPSPRIFINPCGGTISPGTRVRIKVWFGRKATITYNLWASNYTINSDEEWIYYKRITTSGRLTVRVEGIEENETTSCRYTVSQSAINATSER